MAENIDAVRELALQDRYVAYREIEATLGIDSTVIHKKKARILYDTG